MLDDPDGFDRFLEIGLRLKRKRNKKDLFDVLDANEWSESELHETYEAVRGCRRA